MAKAMLAKSILRGDSAEGRVVAVDYDMSRDNLMVMRSEGKMRPPDEAFDCPKLESGMKRDLARAGISFIDPQYRSRRLLKRVEVGGDDTESSGRADAHPPPFVRHCDIRLTMG